VQGISTTRKLTTILSADAAEFSRMMRADEEGTAGTLRRCRGVIDGLISSHSGRIFGTAGDSVIAEFSSPVEALRSAVAIQEAIEKIALELPSEKRMRFRIGINIGDVLVEGNDLIGDGVNIAERIRGLGEPGEIFVSSSVQGIVNIGNEFEYDDFGKVTVKNIAEPIRAYRVRPLGRQVSTVGRKPQKKKRRFIYLAATGFILMLAIGVGLKFGYHRFADPIDSHPGGPERAAHASIAVLPFDNLSGDPAQEYFVDGITDDVISALGKFSELTVLSREATEEFKGKAVSLDEFSKKFDVRYVLHGTVRRGVDRVRVTADLADAVSGKQLWSGSYDGQIKEVFAVQDDITQKVVGTLAIRLNDIERQRSLAKPPENLQAYDYLQRGIDYYHRHTLTDNIAARRMLEKAIELDPNYAAAYVALGYVRLTSAFSGWTEYVAESVRAAKQLAEKALVIDGANAEAHALLGNVYLNLGESEKALVEMRKAIDLNPNDATTYASLGGLFTYNGQADEAIEVFEIALRLYPDMNVGRFYPVGWAYYLAGRYEDAVRVQEAAIRLTPNDYFIYACLAASYAQLNRPAEAATAARDTLHAWPIFSAEAFADQFSGEKVKMKIIDGLHKAGLR
jgi:TolB-like protein/class 3 adenylate cyclase/Tfp pilus assembly protein PilF